MIKTSKRVLRAEYLDILISMNNLALIYKDQERLQEAEKLQISVMERRKKVLGAEHSATLTSMDNLALTYLRQKRFNEAEELQT